MTTDRLDNVREVCQDTPPQNMSLWHKDYSELNATEKKQILENDFLSVYLPKIET